MTLPESPSPCEGEHHPAAFLRLEILRQRADFLRVARGDRQGMQTLLLQALARQDGSDAIRVGFTCSKKVGNAVARNRAKRRLRHIAAELLPVLGRPGWDYVLVGRAGETGAAPYERLRLDARSALARVHKAKK